MKAIKDKKETKFDVEQEVHYGDKREKDRRKEPFDGFTYISTVGWICRREKIRRKNLARPQ